MTIQINRQVIGNSFKTLSACSRGEKVDPDAFSAAINMRSWVCLVGDNLLAFDETKADGDYFVYVADPVNGPQIIRSHLGGIAVGNKLVMPEGLPPRGVSPYVLLQLECPEPDYNIDLSGATGYCRGTKAIGYNEARVFVALSERAISIPDRPEEEQPLRYITQPMLRVRASENALYTPPYVPIRRI